MDPNTLDWWLETLRGTPTALSVAIAAALLGVTLAIGVIYVWGVCRKRWD